MRIVYCTDTYLPEINGVTTVVATMRHELMRRGHTVLLVAPRYGGSLAREPGIIRRAAVPCPGYGAVRLSSPLGRDVCRALDRFEPDLVHLVTEGPIGLHGRRWGRGHGVPLVSSFHTDFPRYAARYLGPWAVGPTRRYLRWFHQASQLTQTPSATTRDELMTLGLPLAVEWGRGVDTQRFTPDRRSEARRAAIGLTPDTPVVLHVSRLAMEKDVDTLVSAFKLARMELGDRAQFVVAGDGPRAAEVRSALPFAIHHGFLERDVLADLYADADLFVFPSPTETCGLVVLEAMASGLPTLTADQGGVVGHIREGLNGHLLPAGDPAAFGAAIVRLVVDPTHRIGLSAGALAFASGQSWQREIDRLLPMYAALIHETPISVTTPESALASPRQGR